MLFGEKKETKIFCRFFLNNTDSEKQKTGNKASPFYLYKKCGKGFKGVWGNFFKSSPTKNASLFDFIKHDLVVLGASLDAVSFLDPAFEHFGGEGILNQAHHGAAQGARSVGRVKALLGKQ